MLKTTTIELEIPTIPLDRASEGLKKTIREFQEMASKGKDTLTPVDELPAGVRVMILAQMDFWAKDNQFLKIENMKVRNEKRDALYASHPFNVGEEWPWTDNQKLGEILKWIEEHP